MKILCAFEDIEKIEDEDIYILNINNNKSFKYTFLNDIKPLKNFFSYEALDLLYISLFVFAADRLFLRDEAEDNWSRKIEMTIPVISIEKWDGNKKIIEELLNFLSGDIWILNFQKRELTKDEQRYKEKLEAKKNRKSFNTLCMLSGGLDSFIGAINLLEYEKNENLLFVSHYGGGKGTKEYQDDIKNLLISEYNILATQFYQNYAVTIDGKEDTTRTRSLMFFAHAICYASAMGQKVNLIIPENGLISLNIPLAYTRLGTSSTRTTHPYYMKKFQQLINALGLDVELKNPFQFKTKGEMITECENYELLASNIFKSMSCSHPDNVRYKGLKESLHCGYCLPCTIRRAAILRGGVQDTSNYFIDFKKNSYLSDDGNNIAKQSMLVYKSAIKKHNPYISFLKVQLSGPLDENISEFSDLYNRGMEELKKYLEECNG